MSDTVLNEAFDVGNEEGTPSRELMPLGKYKAEIVTATVGPTKNGRGEAVTLTWSITEGTFEKRWLFQNCLIKHESADAQRFGRQKLKDVCIACGITESMSDLDTLLYKPCILTVIIRKDKAGQYPDRNEVARVMPVVASWHGPKPTGETVKEATTTPKAFAAVDKDLNDEIPW